MVWVVLNGDVAGRGAARLGPRTPVPPRGSVRHPGRGPARV